MRSGARRPSALSPFSRRIPEPRRYPSVRPAYRSRAASTHRCYVITDDIAPLLCDGRLPLPEALDAVEPVVRAVPDGLRATRFSYCSSSYVAPTASLPVS